MIPASFTAVVVGMNIIIYPASFSAASSDMRSEMSRNLDESYIGRIVDFTRESSHGMIEFSCIPCIWHRLLAI